MCVCNVMLFFLFAYIQNQQYFLRRWLSALLVIIRTLMAQCSEEILLSRMSQMNLGFDLLRGITDGKDCISNIISSREKVSPEKVVFA